MKVEIHVDVHWSSVFAPHLEFRGRRAFGVVAHSQANAPVRFGPGAVVRVMVGVVVDRDAGVMVEA